jgi:hypothetical protein
LKVISFQPAKEKMQHQGFPRALARYLNRNENFILVAGIVVVLLLVVALALISRTSLRTTPSTMCEDIKGTAVAYR